MNLRGKGCTVEMTNYSDDYPGMTEPAYILFDNTTVRLPSDASPAPPTTSGKAAPPETFFNSLLDF